MNDYTEVNAPFSQTVSCSKVEMAKNLAHQCKQGLHLTAKIQDRSYVLGSLRLKPRFETEPELYFILY